MHGLDVTFATLAQTENNAAVPLLLRAIDSSQRNIRELAFRALLHRKSLEAELAVLRRWHLLPEHARQIITEKPGWLSDGIRKGIVCNEEQLHANTCAAAVDTLDYDSMPHFCEATADRANLFGAASAHTVLRLAECLHELLNAPRDYRERRDPQSIRAFVLPSLERALYNASPDHRPELVEAFLLIAGRENAGLKRMVEQPNDKISELVLSMLETTSRAGIIHYLLSCLDDPFMPQSIRSICCRRTDISFLRQLFRRIGRDPTKTIRNNIRKMDKCGWLVRGPGLLEALTEAEQAGAATWAAFSGMDRDAALEVVAYLVRNGGVMTRRTAVGLLSEFDVPAADELILLAAHDEDPQVRALAAPLLRQHKIAGGMQRLLEMVDSANEMEQEAARQALEEFRFANFLEVFDSLSEAARVTTGMLVKRVDRTALKQLSDECQAKERSRRRRALEIIVAMQAISELHWDVSQLLHDEDEFLRVDAVRAIAKSDIPETRAALRTVLSDPSPLVRQVAEEALAKLSFRNPNDGSPMPTFEGLPNALGRWTESSPH